MLSPGGAEVTLMWSPTFTSRYEVGTYRVSMTPDPSSCSNNQVRPSENVTCLSLVLGTNYNFTFGATNCGYQIGDTETLNILMEGITCSIHSPCMDGHLESPIQTIISATSKTHNSYMIGILGLWLRKISPTSGVINHGIPYWRV